MNIRKKGIEVVWKDSHTRALATTISLVERYDPAALPTIMLFPMGHVFLDQGLIQADNPLEQVDCLFAVVDFRGGELIDRLVVRLELASLKEWHGILDERHGCQLGQVLIVVKRLFTALDTSLQFDDAALDLIF